ncbi:MAG: ABC transporter ATP-binding protein [Candidatus Bathyarchaeia archaeon]
MELVDIKMHFHVRSGILKSVAVRAVDGVSLSLSRGETLALVGESGCGKTTLGKLSLRLLKPTSGRIFFDGIDITDREESELRWFRKMAQAIFQDPYSSINPFMKVYEIIEEPLIIHGVKRNDERRALIYRALEEVKLTPVEDVATKYPHLLSGGQRQKVGIARALILRPNYIVADEPVSMIDASSRAEILYLLRDLQQKYSITFMYITHDIATARHFSDRIAVMYLGRIVELGPSEEVIDEALHPYTTALIEAVPEPDPSNRFRERKVIPGEPPSPVRLPSGCRFHTRCPTATRRCEVDEPPLLEAKSGHFVACHLEGQS